MMPRVSSGSIRLRLTTQLVVVAAVLSIVFVYSVWSVGKNTAETTQDKVLSAAAASIADALRTERGELVVDIPYSTFSMLEAISDDRIFYRIIVNGTTVTGYEDLPADPSLVDSRVPHFSNNVFVGEDVRTVAVKRSFSALGVPVDVVVFVAQTRAGYTRIASDVLSVAAWVGSGFFLFAIVLCLVASQSALRPLREVARAVERRGPEDLRPMRQLTPVEITPLVSALNGFISRLESSLNRAEEFIADAAHCLRTPLAMIRTNAEIALRTTRSTPSRQALREILKAADESSRSTGQLLDHATVTFRSDNMKVERVEVVSLVADTIDRFEPVAEMKGIRLLSTPGRTTVDCRADPVLLRSALGNIIDNAIKYSPADSVIRVSTDLPSDRIRISVCDQGRGFGEKSCEMLTGRFTRGDNVEDIIGSGLGLTIVAKVVDSHQGELCIASNPEGAGTCVSIILPP